MRTSTPTDCRALLGVARAAVFEIATPSAHSNITDVIAAHAVEQYFVTVQRGGDIRNPHGWVAVTARRRAIGAMRTWGQEKKRNRRVDVDDRSAALCMVDASNRLTQHIDGDGFDRVRTALLLNALINSVIAEPVNREIAVRCIVHGEKPGVVGTDLGLEVPVVSNRVARIKAKLKSEISVEDLRS